MKDQGLFVWRNRCDTSRLKDISDRFSTQRIAFQLRVVCLISNNLVLLIRSGVSGCVYAKCNH